MTPRRTAAGNFRKEWFIPVNDQGILVGKGKDAVRLRLDYANRHGLVAGATGTGKTVTLQSLAEGFSKAGVPVFAQDVKGDLSGVSQPGGGNPKVEERFGLLGLDKSSMPALPSCSGISLGSRGIRYAPPSRNGAAPSLRLLGLNDTQRAS